jgi:hypothetical protein
MFEFEFGIQVSKGMPGQCCSDCLGTQVRVVSERKKCLDLHYLACATSARHGVMDIMNVTRLDIQP